MAEAIRAWLAIADEEKLPIQFETHRNSVTNDLFSTLLLLAAVPEMRMQTARSCRTAGARRCCSREALLLKE
jgi:hypothetical protein